MCMLYKSQVVFINPISWKTCLRKTDPVCKCHIFCYAPNRDFYYCPPLKKVQVSGHFTCSNKRSLYTTPCRIIDTRELSGKAHL